MFFSLSCFFSQSGNKDSLRIYFEKNDFSLSAESKQKLDILIKSFKSTIGSRPCSIYLGDRTCYDEKLQNKEITFKRYYSIIDYFVSKGVEADNFLCKTVDYV